MKDEMMLEHCGVMTIQGTLELLGAFSTTLGNVPGHGADTLMLRESM